MFTIHRNNLNKIIYAKRVFLRKIKILLEKIKLKILIKISKPCSIFNDLEYHINQKKRICSAYIYNFIYIKLNQINKELENGIYNQRKINYIIIYMSKI